MRCVLNNCRDKCFDDCFWNWIFNASLNDARSPSMGHGENVAEIKIMSEHDEPMFSRETHDFRIESFRITDIGPVTAFDVTSGEKLYPLRGEIHVDEDFHLDDSGTSNSSARHAAYARASVMSSFSR